MTEKIIRGIFIQYDYDKHQINRIDSHHYDYLENNEYPVKIGDIIKIDNQSLHKAFSTFMVIDILNESTNATTPISYTQKITQSDRERRAQIRQLEKVETKKTNLNKQQKEAVEHKEGPLRIIAGAGTGKTHVITEHIANLLKDNTDLAHSILAITFTNKASNELVERLIQKVGEHASGITCKTFHSFCAQIIRENIDYFEFLNGNLNIIDEDEKNSIISNIASQILEYELTDPQFPNLELLSTLRNSKKPLYDFRTQSNDNKTSNQRYQLLKHAKPFISKMKISNTKPAILPHYTKEENMEIEPWFTPQEKLQHELYAKTPTEAIQHLNEIIYARYQTKLISSGQIDFDDLQNLAVELLEANPHIRNVYKERYQYIYIDEYQDTSDIQYQLTTLIADNKSNVTIVGDPDQNIYTWRGASISNMQRFNEQFKPKSVVLDQNYRSRQYILDAANNLIYNNPNREHKNLQANNIEKGSVQLPHFTDAENEAQFIADYIKELTANGQKKFSDFAILVRNHALSTPISFELLRQSIPYQVPKNERIYDREVVKTLLSYLKLLVNPKDNLAFDYALARPAKKIGTMAKNELFSSMQRSGKTLTSRYNYIGSKECMNDAQFKYTTLQKYLDFKTKLETCRHENILITIKNVIDTFELEDWQKKKLELNEGDNDGIRMELLYSVAKNYIDMSYRNLEEPTLSGLLSSIQLMEEYDLDDEPNKVQIQSIHASKGLEYDTVFILGFQQNILPSGKFPNETLSEYAAKVQEERRLAYVAITRAKNTLFIPITKKRFLYNREFQYSPSEFLKELNLPKPK